MTANPWLLPGPGRVPDLNIVRQALSLLADPSAGIQVTCAPAWSFATFAGAEGIEGAAAWVAAHGDSQGIYYALNPVDVALPTRCKNADALRRRWLLIDVDRVKTDDNKHLSADHREHADALRLAEEVREHLHGLGWPDPGLHLDSGNGAHLLYRIDWPNDQESQKAIAAFLKGLAAQFDGPRGELDRSVHDARRVSKLPGTWARKGPSSAERPHRMAAILGHDSDPGLVSMDMVRIATPNFKEATPTTLRPVPQARTPWVLVPPSSEDTAEKAWARQALAGECERMRSAKPGSLNSQLFRSAAALGNLISGGLLYHEDVVDALLEVGEQAGCDNPKKDRATVERGIEVGKLTPRKPQPRQQMMQSQPPPSVVQPAPQADRKGHPVAQDAISRAAGIATSGTPLIVPLPTIMSSHYPEPRYAVQGIVSEGLNLLVGKPKLGKSWLALNLAITIAAGGVALGNVPVTAGPVLYLALEDRFRRVQSRSKMVLGGLAMEASEGLHVAVDWPRLDAGGLDYLCDWIEGQGCTEEDGKRMSAARLIIIDVWAKFRPIQNGSRASAYDVDYAHMTALKNVLDYYGTSALVLHHTRKAAAADAMDEVSGTAGIAGCADGVAVLTRARMQEGAEMEAELLVMPRDHEEQKLALVVDQKTWVWTSQGKTSDRAEGKVTGAVLRVMAANAGLTLSTRTIMDSLQAEPKPSLSYLRNVLGRLTDGDKIERVRDGYYRLPVTESPF